MLIKTSPIWNYMSPAALRRLALAVALIFATFGPLQTLMEPVLNEFVWMRLTYITLLSAGMAASIILFGKKFLPLLLIIAFFTAVIVASAFIEGAWRDQAPAKTESVTLTAAQLGEQKNWRYGITMLGIFFIAAGYAMFIYVFGKEVDKRARLETEMNLAQNIQKSLLPSSPMQTTWYEVAGLSAPATEIGGDYFDIIPLSQDEVMVVIGDVAGHGIGAGILAAMTKSALRCQIEHEFSPRQVLENLNKTLYYLSEKNVFVTFACILLNKNASLIKLATAGHPPVFHYAADTKQVRALRTPGLGLGLTLETAFDEMEIAWQANDRFLLYTDGVIETSNESGEQFDEERLRAYWLQNLSFPVHALCEGVIKSVREFGGNEALKDDVTVVSIMMKAATV